MPITKDEAVYALAEAQHGYFTTAQAEAAGLRRNMLTKMAIRGAVERVSRGVYRITHFPISPFSQYVEAMLWPEGGVQAVISHQSALAFHGLSDVSPSKIHITLPRSHRVRREPPKHLALHYGPLDESDVQVLEGVSVTTPARSIGDAHSAHLSRALLRQAIEQGRETGKLSAQEAQQLEELLADGATTTSAAAPRSPCSRSSSSSSPSSSSSSSTTRSTSKGEKA
jgi:hypothetical protein